MTNSRDRRNFQKGYQEALLDVYKAILVGGEEEALEWIRNNSAPTQHLFDQALEEHLSKTYD